MKYKKLIKGEEFEFNYITYIHITSMRVLNMPIKVDFYLFTTSTLKEDGTFLINEDLWMADNKPTFKDAPYIAEIADTDLDLKLGRMFAQGIKRDELYREFNNYFSRILYQDIKK